MTKKAKKQKLPAIASMLSKYKQAWEATNRSNPFGLDVDRQLADLKAKFTTYDVKVKIGVLRSKKKLTPAENKFADFVRYTHHCREQSLVDAAAKSVPGQIFLLRTQCGYKDGFEHSVTERVETVVTYGQD